MNSPRSESETRSSDMPVDRIIDPNQVVPLYHQIYLILREQILEGRYYAQPLPGELALADQFKVSRVTMRRALQDLVKEGLIARGRGKGTFARPRREAAAPVTKNVSGLLENLVSLGLDSAVDVLEVARIVPPVDVLEALQMGPRDYVQKAVRIRMVRQQPLAHLTTYIPEAIAQGFGRRELQVKPILVLLEESGVKVGKARQSVSARLADAGVASALQVPVGAPLLAVTRVVHDVQGRPVQLLRGLYRPDRYDYRMDLERTDEDGVRVWVHREQGDVQSEIV